LRHDRPIAITATTVHDSRSAAHEKPQEFHMADNPQSDADLHILGSELSNRIEEWQLRIATMAHKCEHHVLADVDPKPFKKQPGAHQQGVGFKKEGSDWKLFFVETGLLERDPNPMEEYFAKNLPFAVGRAKPVIERYERWKPLLQCSLTEKSNATKLIPALLDEMEREYTKRTLLISDALEVLDRLDADPPPGVKDAVIKRRKKKPLLVIDTEAAPPKRRTLVLEDE
jgi:hypothetical protein